MGAGAGLLPAVVAARLASATLNFAINRRLVFDPNGHTRARPGGQRRSLEAVDGEGVVLAHDLLPRNDVERILGVNTDGHRAGAVGDEGLAPRRR